MLRLLALFAVLFALPVFAFDRSHARLDAVLKKHVRDATVDYAALKADRAELDGYLRDCAAVKEAEFREWTQPQQLAFLINLYNAATLQLVIDHYPVRSIKQIGSLFKSPWELETVTLFGRKTTLDEIEHGMLRRDYAEPRLHFAIVCAARGCPPLRPEAYVADRLNAQLDEQGRIFLRNPKNNRLDAARRTVHLSPIFKWFSADFGADDNARLKFISQFLSPEDERALASARDWRIRYTDYDWSLNDRARKK
jgi:hypothetical protein